MTDRGSAFRRRRGLSADFDRQAVTDRHGPAPRRRARLIPNRDDRRCHTAAPVPDVEVRLALPHEFRLGVEVVRAIRGGIDRQMAAWLPRLQEESAAVFLAFEREQVTGEEKAVAFATLRHVGTTDTQWLFITDPAVRTAREDGRLTYLSNLFVHPDALDQNLSMLMLAARVAWCHERGLLPVAVRHATDQPGPTQRPFLAGRQVGTTDRPAGGRITFLAFDPDAFDGDHDHPGATR